MTSDWFQLPETGGGTTQDPTRPDTLGYDVAYSGATSPGNAPFWFVRVYGGQSTLDALADEPGVQRLSDLPVQTLNNMLEQDRDAEGWRRGFNLGGGQ